METAVKEAVAVAIQMHQPVLMWGPPGTGKTSYVNGLAEQFKCDFETIIASIREPSDFGGLPVVRKEGVTLEAPAWARRLAESKALGILFIDEISTAPPAVQAALLRVVLDRVVGDLALPDYISVVAAANPPEEAAGGWTLAPPLANRFFHFDWTVNFDAWCNGAVEGWKDSSRIPKLPEKWREGIPAALALVASFIRSRPVSLYQLPKDEDAQGRAWASPRTWEMAAKGLAACEAMKASEDIQIQLITGAVGNGPAGEFLVWKRELDLPDPEWLLKNPTKFQLPDRPDKTFAVLSSVVVATINKLDSPRWSAAWDILARAAKQGSPDVAAFAARTLARKMDASLPVPTKQMPAFTPILKDAGIIND